jgi:hypothetical protein
LIKEHLATAKQLKADNASLETLQAHQLALVKNLHALQKQDELNKEEIHALKLKQADVLEQLIAAKKSDTN